MRDPVTSVRQNGGFQCFAGYITCGQPPCWFIHPTRQILAEIATLHLFLTSTVHHSKIMFRLNLSRKQWVFYESKLYALAVSEPWICGIPETFVLHPRYLTWLKLSIKIFQGHIPYTSRWASGHNVHFSSALYTMLHSGQNGIVPFKLSLCNRYSYSKN